jgi:hypothetical protein
MDHDPDPPTQPLIFHGVLNEDDVVQLNRYANRLQARRWLSYLAVGLCVMTTALVLWVVVLQGMMGLAMPWYVQIAFVLTVLIWVYPLVARDSLTAWLARRHYRRHAAGYLKTEVMLAADRVAIVNEAYRSELRWSLVGLVAATPAGILFCNQAQQPLFWLPNRVLEDDHSVPDVLTLAEANGVRVRRVE